MDDLLVVFFMLYGGVWASGVLVGFAYKRRLQTLYPDLAAKLYPPRLQKSIATDWRAMQFVLLQKYRSLDNKDFVSLCDTYRYLLLLVMVGMVVLAVAIRGRRLEKSRQSLNFSLLQSFGDLL